MVRVLGSWPHTPTNFFSGSIPPGNLHNGGDALSSNTVCGTPSEIVYILGFPSILVTWNCYSFPLFLSVDSVIKRLSFVSVQRKKKQESVKVIIITKCLLTGLVRSVLKQRKDLCCGQKLGVTSFFVWA